MYIELLKEIFTNSSMTVHTHKEATRSTPGEEYDREIPYRPSRLSAALQSIFRRLTWETRGLKIEGKYLSDLRFTDDILICANALHELQLMLQEFADENKNQGLKMNKSNTKVMMENDTHQYRSTTLKSRSLKATSTWDRDTAPETKTKTRRFKEGSRLGE